MRWILHISCQMGSRKAGDVKNLHEHPRQRVTMVTKGSCPDMAVTTGCHGYQVPLPYFRIELSSGNFNGIAEPYG